MPPGFGGRAGVAWESGGVQPRGHASVRAVPAAQLRELAGQVVHEAATGTSTLITAVGRFEFFRDAGVMFRLFDEAGLVSLAVDRSEGLDTHGLNCRRHRCLLAKSA
jgi:hypothetical protein